MTRRSVASSVCSLSSWLGTRYGPVILAKAEAAPPRWRVTFDGRTLLETEFDELGLWEVFEGDDDRDHVVVRRSSGGIACPYRSA